MLLEIIEKLLSWLQTALVVHSEALMKLFNFKLCITTYNLANCTLGLLRDCKDFQEGAATFCSVLPGVWKH